MLIGTHAMKIKDEVCSINLTLRKTFFHPIDKSTGMFAIELFQFRSF